MISSKKCLQKAIIFVRVSSVNQVEGHSLDAQVSRLQSYYKQNNLEIMKEFSITEDLKTGEREQFHEMIDFIKKQKEPIALVVDAVDRLKKLQRSTNLRRVTNVWKAYNFTFVVSLISSFAFFLEENLSISFTMLENPKPWENITSCDAKNRKPYFIIFKFSGVKARVVKLVFHTNPRILQSITMNMPQIISVRADLTTVKGCDIIASRYSCAFFS